MISNAKYLKYNVEGNVQVLNALVLSNTCRYLTGLIMIYNSYLNRHFKAITIFTNYKPLDSLVFSRILSDLKLIHLKTLSEVN